MTSDKERDHPIYPVTDNDRNLQLPESASKDHLWNNLAIRMISTMKEHGYYFEIDEEGPPYRDVQFGIFCEMMIQDELGKLYELKIYQYHYPGDPGQSEILQIYKQGDDALCVDIIFRSNGGPIRNSQTHRIIQNRKMSRSLHSLSPEQQQLELTKLTVSIPNIFETQRLFEKRKAQGRKVNWIRESTRANNALLT